MRSSISVGMTGVQSESHVVTSIVHMPVYTTITQNPNGEYEKMATNSGLVSFSPRQQQPHRWNESKW